MQQVTEQIQQLSLLLGQNLVSIYRVGIIDDSSLCDLDLVLIVNDPSSAQTILHPHPLSNVDIRGLFTPKQFALEQIYLPYAEITPLFGQAIQPASPPPANANTIKLATMFFYAFQRNYYLYLNKPNRTKEILTRLNDFEYALKWLPESQKKIGEFVNHIRDARRRYPNLSDQETQKLLQEGITAAWWLAGEINLLLSKQPIKEKIISQKELVEPTKFFKGNITICRQKTERLTFIEKRAKKIILPDAFQTLLLQPQNSFITLYVKTNATKKYRNPLDHMIHLIKMSV